MNGKKTILITAPYFPPQGGGLERYALEIARGLSSAFDWRVVVVCANEKKEEDRKEEMNGITIYRLKPDLRFSNTPLAFGWFGKIKKIIKEEKPDVINVHTPVPGLGDITSFLGRNIPQVVTYHTGSMKKGNYLDICILAYEKIVLGFMLRRAHRIICSSDFVRMDFLKRYMDKSETITPGIDCNLFAPDSKLKSGQPKVLFVAKLERGQEYKGLRTLLDAVKILKKDIPDIKLDVAGDGNLKSEYENYAKTNGLEDNVNFRGRLEGQELVKAYQSAWAFSLPTRSDSQPLVILEAMASGLAIVSTKIGGIPTMIKDGKEGFLIEPDNAEILAEEMSMLLDNPELRERFAKAARERAVKDFSWQSRLEAYDAALRSSI